MYYTFPENFYLLITIYSVIKLFYVCSLSCNKGSHKVILCFNRNIVIFIEYTYLY